MLQIARQRIRAITVPIGSIPRMSSARSSAAALAAALLLVLSACNATGPRAVRTARTAYNQAVVDTWNEQLLLNLVRLRYRDTPFFLEVSSVSTQYSLGANASAGGRVGDGDAGGDVGLGAGWSESPTITYAPLAGEKFVSQLLAPISLGTLFLLPQSGWSIERVLRCCVQRLNDLPNAPSAAGPTPTLAPRFEEFHHAARLLRELQVEGGLELGVRRPVPRGEGARSGEAEEAAEEAAPVGPYVVRFPRREEAPGIVELRRLLGTVEAAEGSLELTFTVGALDRERGELAVFPRSLMGVLFYLSQAVEPPEPHLAKGWATVTRDASGGVFDWRRVTGDLLRVPSSRERPAEAFIAVPYRGAWFYIADDDLESKSTFGLLAQLFSLQAGDSRSLVPVLTLPLGG